MIAPSRFNLWFFVMFLSICIEAQNLSIIGEVVDDAGIPIEFANVVLQDAETLEFLKGTSTDDLGRFVFNNLEALEYRLNISYIGFKSFEQKIVLTGNLDLKRIILTETAETLEQVDIVSRKPTITRKPDRLIFNVENTALAEGSTLGVLRSTPGVIVSEGSINVKSAAAVVYINDRRVQLTSDELIQLLESAPANSIKSVEVITNPPANYDADSGTVINIIMSKNLATGYRGSVNTAYTQGVFPRYKIGTSQYFKNNKINLNVNYNYNSQKINRANDDTVNYLDEFNAISEIWNSKYGRNTWSETHNLNINFDYFLDEKNTLSFTSTALYMPYFKYKIRNITRITDAQEDFLSRFTADNLSRDTKYNVGSDLIFTHNFDNNSKLAINGHYTTYNYERDQNVVSNFFDDNNSFLERTEFNTLANQETEIITASADYSTPLGENAEFSSGLKYANVQSDSDITRFDVINDEDIIDPNNSNTFLYDEKVFAAYTNYSASWDKWDLTIGLRVEQTNINGESLTLNQTNTQDYLNWFPNLSISHQIGESFSVYANYKRSITRPNFSNLNPFTFFFNENLVFTGNPELRPEYLDHITLGTSFLEYFTIEAYYMTYNGNIQELPRQDNATNILAFTPVNLDNVVDYGLDFSVDIFPTRWWYISALTSFYNISQSNSFGDEVVDLEQWSNLTILQNNFRLLKDNSLNIGLNVTYMNTNLQNLYLVGTRYISSLNVSKTLFNKKGTLSLTIEDLFNEQDYQIDTNYLNQSSQSFMNLDNRFITLGFRYNFGNTGLSTNEKSTSAEERNRIKNID